jgi:preprotein translocase subunit SecF
MKNPASPHCGMAQEPNRKQKRLIARRLLADDERVHTHPSSSYRPGRVGRFFDQNYRKLQMVSLFILFLCIGYNGWFFFENDDFVRKGVSLAGGTSFTVSTEEPVDSLALENVITQRYSGSDVSIRSLGSAARRTGFTVDIAGLPEEGVNEIRELLAQRYPNASLSVETTGSSLGDAFFKQTLLAVLVAFVCMGVVVFISFRSFYPSAAVILASFSTVISTLAVFNALGFALSTAGVAAFLMLIGYSIDTDVLLSTRVLRRDGHFIQNVWSAAKTGLTMQFTTMFAVVIVLLFSNNAVFDQIMLIVLIGMFFDVLYTWIQNAALLKWYVERKETKHHLSAEGRA